MTDQPFARLLDSAPDAMIVVGSDGDDAYGDGT